MITLTILRADGSLYWTEYFNDMASAQAWLATEQTRPYWQASFTTTFTDTTPLPPTQAQVTSAAWAALRSKRDGLLSACDWTQMQDSPLSANAKQAWASYRTALRQLPDQAGVDPTNPTWPVPPS